MVYVALIMSDGDNLAEDWSTLRPALERRIALNSSVPISWTVSNRWSTFGPPVLRWFYRAAATANGGGYDSFLMGPSGYGYLFPGNITDEAARRDFARRTISAAEMLSMQGYVHWDERCVGAEPVHLNSDTPVPRPSGRCAGSPDERLTWVRTPLVTGGPLTRARSGGSARGGGDRAVQWQRDPRCFHAGFGRPRY